MPDYKVKLDVFEGPLDLLLHLIREHELNIYDIPISTITKQYVEYINIMKDLNLEVAGEFLVMAATLTYIKSRTLLPSTDDDHEDDEGEDPRDELMRRLIEYKKFKEAAEELGTKEDHQKQTFARNFISEWDEDDSDYLREISIFKLLGAFDKLLKTLDPDKLYEIRLEEISVTEKMNHIMSLLEKSSRLKFEDFFLDAKSRMELIGTLLALLELMKQQMIRVLQEGEFGKIWVHVVEDAESQLREDEIDTGSAVIEELDIAMDEI